MLELELLILYGIIYSFFLSKSLWNVSPGVLSKIIRASFKLFLLATFFSVCLGAAIWLFYHHVFGLKNINFLYFITFIGVLAAFLQLFRKMTEKCFQNLYCVLKILFPLIIFEVLVFGLYLFFFIPKFGFVKASGFGIGYASGRIVWLLAFISIRERLYFSNIPKFLEGFGITLIIVFFIFLASRLLFI